MNDKRKSRPLVAQETGQAETAAGQAAISIPYSNMVPAGRQLRVSDILCRGRGNAQTMRELKQVLNGDSRSIRLQIEQERRRGCPIVSDCQHGYWLAETRAEIETFCRSMRSRAFEIQKTAAIVQLAELEAGSDG